MSTPVFSVITPTLDRRDYLKKTILSIQGQTFQRWEMLIMDDGSSDGTFEMVRDCFGTDPRIRFVKRGRGKSGANACRNEGIRLSSGKYLVFLDSDDLLAQDSLEGRIRDFERNPECDFLVFQSRIFFKEPADSDVLWNYFDGENDLDRFLAFDLPWGTISAAWKKEAVCGIGLWDEKLPSLQDMELHIRALASGLKYKKIERVDSYYRVGTPNSIGIEANKSVEHLKSRGFFVRRIQSSLVSAGLLTPERRKMLVRLHAYLCDGWMERKKPFMVMACWFRGFLTGLYGPRMLIRGWQAVLEQAGNPEPAFSRVLSGGKSFIKDTSRFYIFNPDVQKVVGRHAAQKHCGESGKKLPFISFVLPTFNRGAFIEKALLDLIEEKALYPEMEIIVVDGGSRDNTCDIIRKYEDRIAFWISEPDRGPADAFNKGVRKASGDYVRLFSDDDRLVPGSTRKMAEFLADHPDVDILGAQADSFDSDGAGNLRPSAIPKVKAGPFVLEDYAKPHSKGMMITETCFMKKRLFEEIGYWDPGYGVFCDVDFFIRAMKAGKKVFCLDLVAARKIWHPGSTSNRSEWKYKNLYLRSILKNAGFSSACDFFRLYMVMPFMKGITDRARRVLGRRKTSERVR